MLILLSLVNLLLFPLALRRLPTTDRRLTDWRQIVLLGCVIWGLWLTLITEILSLFNALHLWALVAAWSMALLFVLWLIYQTPSPPSGFPKPGLPASTFLPLAGIVFVVGLTGVVALISPPNNWDSMTYHMVRVMHWLQNGTVAHYATHEVRQLYLNPWAEFAILHFQLLSGGDVFANGVQWLSMVGSVIGVSLIARQLGARLTGQVFASLVAATIPMGLLQTVTTQNDWVVTFWLVCFVSFVITVRRELSWIMILGCGGSLALGFLTKGTAYLYAAPFLIWLGLSLFKTLSWRAWWPLFTMGLIVLIFNSGHYARNLPLFGSPLQPQSLAEYDYRNQSLTPALAVSNVVRNLALHINVPLPALTRTTAQAVQTLHHGLGIDLNDPRTTWIGTQFEVNPFFVSEDASGNFIHLILIGLCFGVVVVRKIQKRAGEEFTYVMLLTTAFLLFSFYLKWQPWHSRLHLPLFVLWTPVIGLVLPQKSLWLSHLLTVLLIGQSLPFLLTNPNHPLTGPNTIFNKPRNEQYFLQAPLPAEAYTTVIQLIEQAGHCSDIGLVLPGNFWEYPFWFLLAQSAIDRPHIENVEVKNESAVLQNNRFEPCAVVCINCPPAAQIRYTEQFDGPAFTTENNFIFLKYHK
ncbi:MAG: glycosyltransferase family 39 protein [Anaerolineae bacterium]|nr:glycosyltransferase family 39 protein [Anaerolineae bacterium]